MGVTIIGQSDHRIFGLAPAERLRRQWQKQAVDLELVAVADVVLGETLIAWLRENPERLLIGGDGAPLAIAVPPARIEAAQKAMTGNASGFESVPFESAAETYDRKLRRRLAPLAARLSTADLETVEKALFAHVYKGVTDFVTKWAWPVPAFWLTRMLAGWRVHPNLVTFASLLLVFAATWYFYVAAFGPALLAAWGMTFLDTVDGKLARVTITSSKFGDLFDHGTDLIHPPFWWLALGWGLVVVDPASEAMIIASTLVILACYVLGRLIEGGFKWMLGINQFMWEPFDSAFRLVVARRNPILAIMSVGFLIGAMAPAFHAVALWCILSLLIQAVRFLMAWQSRPITPWMQA